MSDSHIVAVVQAAPVWLQRDASVEKACRLIAEAAADGARLIAFPESFIPAFPYAALHQTFLEHRNFFRELYKQAVEIPSPAVGRLCQAAQQARAIVVIGLTERAGGSLYNTQLFINEDGEILGHRRKLKPTNTERLFWGQGDGSGLRVFSTAVGRVGGLICGEHNLALARYTLQAQAEAIHIASYPDPLMEGRPFADRIDAAVRHYAAEGQCFVLNATGWISEEIRATAYNTPALEAELNTAGGLSGLSGIINPAGQYLAGPLSGREGILLAEINFDRIIEAKYWFDPSGHSGRSDLFQLHVNMEPQPALLPSLEWPEPVPQLNISAVNRAPLAVQPHADAPDR